MFGQVDLCKGSPPQQTQQLIIAEELSYTFSHTTVFSARKGGQHTKNPGTHEAHKRAFHAYHNTSMFQSDKRTQEQVFVGALREHDYQDKYKTRSLPRFRFDASLLQGKSISLRMSKEHTSF